MKVLFDHQLFAYQRYGGASKYFAMLLAHMPEGSWDTTTLFSNNEYVRALDLFKVRHFLNGFYFRGQGRIMNEFNKPYSLMRLRRKDYDVFHQTHFEPYCLKAIGDKPMVTTFHDINFATLNPNPRIVEQQKKSLARADKIIAVSKNTKKDVIEMFNLDSDKVEVVYHGIEKPHYSDDRKILDFPYVLYVGSRENHKNFKRFVDAFAVFHKKFPEIHLVCTRQPFNAVESQRLEMLGLLGCSHFISAREDVMNKLYRDAVMFVFPSLYEGFGMPILEAMVNNCPVVLADASCFPEIAADSALYFDPESIEDMSEKLIAVAQDSELRRDLINKGADRVKLFSWDNCAKGHMKVYESLI